MAAPAPLDAQAQSMIQSLTQPDEIEFHFYPSQHYSASSPLSPILLVPSVAPGNLGQLALDVLLAENEHRVFLGHFNSEFLVPAVGCDGLAVSPSDYCGSLTFPLEYYYLPRYSVCCLQQRVPLIEGANGLFAARLMEWIRQQQFKLVIFLTSTELHQRADSLINSGPCAFYWNAQAQAQAGELKKTIGETMENMNIKEFQSNDIIRPSHDFVEGFDDPESAHPSAPLLNYPGGGVTRWFNRLSTMPILNMLAFTSDSDNALEAIFFSRLIKAALHSLIAGRALPGLDGAAFNPLADDDVRQPLAWRAVFGPPPDEKIYL